MMTKNKICNILDGKYFWVFFAILGALIQTVVFLLTQDSYDFPAGKPTILMVG